MRGYAGRHEKTIFVYPISDDEMIGETIPLLRSGDLPRPPSITTFGEGATLEGYDLALWTMLLVLSVRVLPFWS